MPRKARVLQALMEKYQPEGRHAPITANNPLYKKVVAGLLVAEIRLDRVASKVKLGQNRTPADRVRVLEHLWRRGCIRGGPEFTHGRGRGRGSENGRLCRLRSVGGNVADLLNSKRKGRIEFQGQR